MDEDINIVAKEVKKELQKKYDGMNISVKPSKKNTSLNLYQKCSYIGSVKYKGEKHTMQIIMDAVYKILDRRKEKYISDLKNDTIRKARKEFKEKLKKIIEEEKLAKPVIVNGKKFVKDIDLNTISDTVFKINGIVTIENSCENNGEFHYYFSEKKSIVNETVNAIQQIPFRFCGDKEEVMKFYRDGQIKEWCRLNKQWFTKISDKTLSYTCRSAKVSNLNPITIEYNIGKYIVGKGWSFNENCKRGMRVLEETRKKKIKIPDKPEHIIAECTDKKLICNCYGHVYEYDTYGWKKDGLKEYFKKIRDAFHDVDIRERDLSASVESSFIAQALYEFVQKNQRFVTVKDAIKELRGLKHTGKTIYNEISENGVYNLINNDDILMEIEEMERYHFFEIEKMYWKYGDYYVISLVKNVNFGTEIQSDTFYDDIINEKPVPDTVALQFFNYVTDNGNMEIKTFIDCLHLLKYKGFVCRYLEKYISFIKSAPKEFKQYLQMQKEMSDGFEKKILIKILKK